MKKLARTSASIAGLIASCVLLVGCESLLIGKAPAAPQRETVEPAPEGTEYLPDGSAAENEAYFVRTAKEFIDSDKPLNGEDIVNSFRQAGFEQENMQVTYDKTAIDLEADSIFLSVRFSEQCLIAQFVRADRTYQTELAEAVGPDNNLCLIGNTRPIDW